MIPASLQRKSNISEFSKNNPITIRKIYCFFPFHLLIKLIIVPCNYPVKKRFIDVLQHGLNPASFPMSLGKTAVFICRQSLQQTPTTCSLLCNQGRESINQRAESEAASRTTFTPEEQKTFADSMEYSSFSLLVKANLKTRTRMIRQGIEHEAHNNSSPCVTGYFEHRMMPKQQTMSSQTG